MVQLLVEFISMFLMSFQNKKPGAMRDVTAPEVARGVPSTCLYELLSLNS